ncbi:MAG: ATP-binding protein [Vicinamibacterales bacterium]
MQNPFVYGEVVPPEAFVDRVVELDRLVSDLAASQKIFLISPRRYGKSSLIRRALASMEKRGALTVDVTVSSFSSYIAFLEGYARALVAAETRWDRARTWLRDAVRSARAEIRYAPDPSLMTPGTGSVAVSFPGVQTGRDASRLAQEVFALPARLAAERGKKVVVALDEFQAVAGFNGGSVEHALRAAVQHQRDVGYVFAGSEPSLMEEMLTPKRPFYKAGPVMRLEKIPADEFATFIETRFAESGIKPEAGLGAAVVDLAGNLPYDVQRLAHETWDEVRATRRRTATLDDLHQALRRLLSEQQTMFESRWQRLTLGQRQALRSVVIENGVGLLSAEVRSRHRLGGASSVQTALAALVRDDVIGRDGDRYVVIDSLLREWMARKTF